uniref:Ig-like domain-containing protein n=1 Tax=Lates calcarifer TaxID=8187 RepID=A0A4W6FFD8_LATCA
VGEWREVPDQAEGLSSAFGSTAVPATFKVSLKSQEAEEGSSVTLRCELTKKGVPLQWQREGQVISEEMPRGKYQMKKGRVILKPGEKYKMKQEGRLTKLVINNIEESDAGKYTCKTKDNQSTAELTVQGETSSSWRLSLKHLVPYFIKHLLFCFCKFSQCIQQNHPSADVEEVSFKIEQ